MRRSLALAALALSGCGTFIALGDDYERQCSVIQTIYLDRDGDGDGDPSEGKPFCGEEPEFGYVLNANDCDDTDPSKRRSAFDDECDGIDQNCDGESDDGFSPLDCFVQDPLTLEPLCLGLFECKDGFSGCTPRWFHDTDADGHGDAEYEPSTIPYPDRCPIPNVDEDAAGFPDDCNDADKTIFPQRDAEDNSVFTEICDDPFLALDNDCDGATGHVYLYESFTKPTLSPIDTPFEWWSPTNSDWAIRAASDVCGGPSTDITHATNDNRVLAIGATAGCFAPGNGGLVYSKTIDTSMATSLYLMFSYWINAETIEKKPGILSVWVRQGAVLSFLRSYAGAKAEWQRDAIDISPYRGGGTTIVFSYEIGADPAPGPVIDDVRITDDPCEMPP